MLLSPQALPSTQKLHLLKKMDPEPARSGMPIIFLNYLFQVTDAFSLPWRGFWVLPSEMHKPDGSLCW